MVVHAGGLRIQGQPWLYGKIISQKTKTKQNNNQNNRKIKK
jgi:hypothetical protein